jgi:hypothetical protein
MSKKAGNIKNGGKKTKGISSLADFRANHLIQDANHGHIRKMAGNSKQFLHKIGHSTY